ncbi:primosomal protein N' [Thalassospira permensis]|uniref:Replication restart protein PriA n=1 Tax=Thalassospira permensis NBRC 106175 TaxID=1353532 RepID=A0ABR4TM38_9PROT|nr:primosomal protein N' [Thalassospira permensis]KEO55714.1 primosome assembly protein PriA [Thalassospira permensis NBRC 106175]
MSAAKAISGNLFGNDPAFQVTGETISVLPPLPLAGPYDYLVPEGLSVQPGDFVEIPLGRQTQRGVVWGKARGDVDPAKLREIYGVLQAPPMADVTRKFVDWVSAYTMAPQGAVLRMAMSVADALEPPKPIFRFTLADPAEGEGDGESSLRMTPPRKRVMAFLRDHPPMEQADIMRETGAGASVIKGLVEAGVVRRLMVTPPSPFDDPDLDIERPHLSEAQERAADMLCAKVAGDGFSVTLLDGVTGSGKTEVYFEAIRTALEAGRQVVVLLPEIALSAQWLQRFRDRFGVEPALWHSEVGQARRRDTWRAVADGSAKLVVGARSALFLPYANLGLIVVDEEHEHAFKQEDGVIYHARDMAVARAHLGGIPAILASATPSLETLANVEAGRYERVELSERHGMAVLPSVEIVDIRQDRPERQRWITPTLKKRLAETFAAGEQAMLFLNRRGYAPLTLCRACGHRFQCPNCTAWLVEHRAWGKLQCHHCGYQAKAPDSCPACGAEEKLAACGPGVERLYEEAVETFPQIRIEVATSDNIAGPKAAAELVNRVHNHEVDLLIGTQILAKGYHFPMLTLVGVVDADLGLAGGDLRAAERSYQLMTQVAGRAGRGDRPGTVLLQTADPSNRVIKAIAAGDRDAFNEVELSQRMTHGMPPHGRLAALIISGKKENEVDEAAWRIGRAAPRGDGIVVLGPAPAPLSLLRGRYRRRFLIRADKQVRLQAMIHDWLSKVKTPGSVRVQIDIDPYSFM